MALELKKEDEDTSLDIDTSELDAAVEQSKQNELKEYEKLLLQEENRIKLCKAKKMVKMGLFNQYTKSVTDFDITDLNKLNYVGGYKNYELYENEEGTLFLIDSKNEASEENPDAKTYSYDIIEIENVDEETYAKILKAHAHEMSWPINLCYIGSIIFIIYSIISCLYSIVYCMTNDLKFFDALFVTVSQQFIGLGISLSLFVLATIQKRKFENK